MRQDELLKQAQEQNARLDALLDKWEEQARRYDPILARWERMDPTVMPVDDPPGGTEP